MKGVKRIVYVVLAAVLCVAAAFPGVVQAQAQGQPPSGPGQGMGPGAGGHHMGPGMMGHGMMGPGMMGGGMMGQGERGRGGGMGFHDDPAFDERPLVSLMLRQRQQLGLTAEQVAKLRELRSTFEKEAIRAHADLRILDIELDDLLDAEQVDMAKVEAAVRREEALRTNLRPCGRTSGCRGSRPSSRARRFSRPSSARGCGVSWRQGRVRGRGPWGRA
jgi:hypothetical protein